MSPLMCKTITLVMLVIMVAPLVTSNRHRHRRLQRERYIKFTESIERIREFQNRGPQPHVITMETEEEREKFFLRPSETVSPRQTVLHRCDMASCCGLDMDDYHYCKPTSETVNLYFQAFDVRTRRTRYIKIPYINDTACECLGNEIR